MKSGVLLRATLILMFFGAGVFALPPEYHEMIYSDNKALVGLRCISLSLYVELSGDKKSRDAVADQTIKATIQKDMYKIVRHYLVKKGFTVSPQGTKCADPYVLAFVISLKSRENKWCIITPEVRLKQDGGGFAPWMAQNGSQVVGGDRLFDALSGIFMDLCAQFTDAVYSAENKEQ